MSSPSDLSTADTSFRPASGPPPAGGIPHPRRIGHFAIEAELGRGGMGVVYRARDEKLRRTVALKVLVADSASPDFLQRFLREARSAAKLRHSGIVQVYDIGEDDGRHFFTMEHVDGASLDRVLRSPGDHGFRAAGTGLDPGEAAELARQMAAAVEHAHQLGVIHRDLKPGNILVERKTRSVKVADFGLAKDLTLTPEEARTWARLTRPGMMFGTPSYMSPEQASGRPESIGRHSDTYSLGAVLYEMLSGRPPLEWKSTEEFLREVGTRRPEPLRTTRPDVPRDLERICLKALEKSPGDRYATARAFAADLARFLAGEPILARPVGAWGRAMRAGRRHPRAVGGAVMLLLAVIGGGLYTRHLARDRDRARALAAEAEREKVQRAVERAAAVVPGGDAAVIRGALEDGFVTVTDPALRELAETLRRVAAERLEALHARVVRGLEGEQGSWMAIEADIDGRRAVWEGRLLAVDGRRLVLLPTNGAAVTVPWRGVVPVAYGALVARLIAPASSRDRFDLAIHALFQGRRDEAVTLLERAHAEAGEADGRWKAEAGILLEHLGVETEEKRRERERREREESSRIEAVRERERVEQARQKRRRADREAAIRLAAGWRLAEALERLRDGDETERAALERWAAAWDALRGRVENLKGSVVDLVTISGRAVRGRLLDFTQDSGEIGVGLPGGGNARTSVRLRELADEVPLRWFGQAGIDEPAAGMVWTLYLAFSGERERALVRVYGVSREIRDAYGPWAAALGILEAGEDGRWTAPGEEEWRKRQREEQKIAEAGEPKRAERPSPEPEPSVRRDDLRFLGLNAHGREEYEHPASGIVLVLLPPGVFLMGSPESEPSRQDDERQRTVRISRPFLFGRTEVTNAQYRRQFPGHRCRPAREGGLDDDEQPVVGVTWREAHEFCLAHGFRLPTEVEWEYAARGGEGRTYPWGKQWPPGAGAGNYRDASAREHTPDRPPAEGMEEFRDGFAATAPVGRFAPNPFGLYDLGGNVAEWCAEDPAATKGGTPAGAPIGPGLARLHPIRGASWEQDGPRWLRCAARGHAVPDRKSTSIGFRVVVEVEPR